MYSGFWQFKHFQIIPYTFEAKFVSDVYIDFMEGRKAKMKFTTLADCASCEEFRENKPSEASKPLLNIDVRGSGVKIHT